MAIMFKPIAESSDKYRRRAAVAGPDYEKGVRNPKRPYAAAAIAGEANFAAAMTQVVADKRRSAGILKAGDAKWLEGSVEKGVTRFPTGVALGSKYYEQNLGPIQAKVAATVLPPKGPRGSESNFQIPALVAKAFRAAAGKK